MHSRAADLIATLELVPHPEGGYFREVFRSASTVQPADGRPARSAMTTIYFLLVDGGFSRWHRVSSDEAWHFYEGAPLELLTADASFDRVDRGTLGPVAGGHRATAVVPAGAWQAARTRGEYSLVGCTVGPGFEFDDFQMLQDHAVCDMARRRHPEVAGFI